MTLLRPEYIALLLPIALILILLWLKPRRNNEWQDVIDTELLSFLIPKTPYQKKYAILIGIALTWVITVIALIGPSFKQTLMKNHKRLTPRIILLDLSANMLIKDIRPNRLDRAKFKIKDFLQLATESETALVVFTEEAFLVTPFTEDRNTVLNLMQRLSPNLMPIDGQNIEKALDFAKSLFTKNYMTAGEILLVTGSIPNQNDFDKAAQLAKLGLTTSVLAIGDKKQLPLKTFRTLADYGHGQFQVFQINDSDIRTLANRKSPTKEIEKNSSALQKEDSGYYLIFLLLAIVLLAYRRGLYEQLTGI